MKVTILLLITLFGSFGYCIARADNPGGCYWRKPGTLESIGDQHRGFTVTVPAKMKLQMVGVGQVMASSAGERVLASDNLNLDTKCPTATVSQLLVSYDMAPGSAAELEPGYSDVYKTAVKGVGIRFKSNYYSRFFSVPGGFGYGNGGASINSPVTTLSYDLIRTAQGVGTGDIKLDFIIRYQLSGWHAGSISASGVTRVEADNYFSGCAGVTKNPQVPMGKVWSGELKANTTRTEALNLDVLCTGLPAGSKLPVKVYFEGASPGDGRLNLLGAGASGVEISLQNGKGQALPFAQSRAMSMDWLRSDIDGELYSLPIRARYVKKSGAAVEPGRADAVLNYVLQYN